MHENVDKSVTLGLRQIEKKMHFSMIEPLPSHVSLSMRCRLPVAFASLTVNRLPLLRSLWIRCLLNSDRDTGVYCRISRFWISKAISTLRRQRLVKYSWHVSRGLTTNMQRRQGVTAANFLSQWDWTDKLLHFMVQLRHCYSRPSFGTLDAAPTTSIFSQRSAMNISPTFARETFFNSERT